MSERLYEISAEVEITNLNESLEESFVDELIELEVDDCDNPYGFSSKRRGGYVGKGYRRWLYIDGFLTESAYEKLEDLLDTYGLKMA